MFAEYFGRRSLLSIFLVGYLIGGNNSADANDHVNNDRSEERRVGKSVLGV